MKGVSSAASATVHAGVNRRAVHVGHDVNSIYCRNCDGSYMFLPRKAAIFRPSISQV